ncbi:hypothetical protein PISL3812_09619 [Talaromyces islandicus]|uniref:Uncharacterized protein n=1 Tax=Talaromyces islandicus TaxID=28573 RepID=A0A0U1MAA5_TALIS|nr:hypothetical protein PISL3812_09619 [Talaromyces islandicus]
MALQDINNAASKETSRNSKPVLTDEDEAFLERVISRENPQDPKVAGNDAQIALMDGAQDIPLPMSPTEELTAEPSLADKVADKTAATEPGETKKKSRPWSTWLKRGGTLAKKGKKAQQEPKEPATVATDPTAIATAPKTAEGANISDSDQQQEQEDLATVLERLNLAAENNRVFSVGDETQELLQKFKLIFKDLVTGVPTAYRDLESLLTNGDKQLKDAFGQLPSFLQKLVEQLPEKFGPELMAAASEKPSQSGAHLENAGKAAAAAQKMGFKVPNLKELVGKPTALVGMLRSITTFLRARFPAVLGVNVLWSLALFIVLLALWYCHKRGREVRLENERLVTEAEVAKLNEENSDQQIRPTETLSTTAPRDAPISAVREGVEQVQKARGEAEVPDPAANSAVQPSVQTPGTAVSSGKSDNRRFSLFRSFSKRTNYNDTKIQPYPGT